MGCSNPFNVDHGIDDSSIKIINFTVSKIYNHDTSSFTEGLVWLNGYLYESTGLEKKSTLKKIDLSKNFLVKSYKIKDSLIFAEGITSFGKFIYQLSWKNQIGYIYDTANLTQLKEFKLPFKEAWGITHNDTCLIISDGSSKIYFVNPYNFNILNFINVNDNYGPVSNINELELINGFIYANIWQNDKIIKINSRNGNVEAYLDLSDILNKTGITYNPKKIDVLNGIAYDSVNNNLFVTGKFWPVLFSLKMQP